jgi:extracellular factor (EF) 3-hydroxypalmitic acid methyl ester biosynthesis protein
MRDEEFVRTLIERNGPNEADYPDFTAWTEEIYGRVCNNRLTTSELSGLRVAFGEAFSPKTMQGFAYTKPYGYAGDFEIIDRIYQNYICPDPELAAWDRYFQAQAASIAVRNRKTYFHALLDKHSARKRPFRVLKIASGPGRSMFEWLSSRPSADVHFDCIEVDAKAIEFASNLNRSFLKQITFTQRNALRYRPETQYDLIWAAGIFDYFPDKVFTNLLRRLLPAIAEGGEIVIGNFCVTNPCRAYMELFNWILNHRSAEDLLRLAKECGVSPDRLTIGREAANVNLFLHVAHAFNG